MRFEFLGETFSALTTVMTHDCIFPILSNCIFASLSNHCETRDLGCWADGLHKECRFCGDVPYVTECPENAKARNSSRCKFNSNASFTRVESIEWPTMSYLDLTHKHHKQYVQTYHMYVLNSCDDTEEANIQRFPHCIPADAEVQDLLLSSGACHRILLGAQVQVGCSGRTGRERL